MQYEVLKGFMDQESGQPVEHGSTFECTEARFKEIQAKGNYLFVKAEKVAETGDMKLDKATKKQKGH